MSVRGLVVWLALLCAAAACGGGGGAGDDGGAGGVDGGGVDGGGVDGSGVDGGGGVHDAGANDVGANDAGANDAGANDAGDDGAGVSDASDGAGGGGGGDTLDSADAEDDASAGEADAGAGDKITAWGSISGACGAVAAELLSAGPSFLTTTYSFSASTFDPAPLAAGAKKRFEGENAGGSSKCSEVMSMQFLVDCEGASAIKTEKEIRYDSSEGAITDYAATIAGTKVGVSVTRAYLGPKTSEYSESSASSLLSKKLAGINASSAKVSAADKWAKQILHIWTLQPTWVPILAQAYGKLDASLRADTIVLVTVETGPGWIVTDDCGAP